MDSLHVSSSQTTLWNKELMSSGEVSGSIDTIRSSNSAYDNESDLSWSALWNILRALSLGKCGLVADPGRPPASPAPGCGRKGFTRTGLLGFEAALVDAGADARSVARFPALPQESTPEGDAVRNGAGRKVSET